MRTFILLILLGVPSLCFANTPTEADLLRGVESMPMPGLDKRMKARAQQAQMKAEIRVRTRSERMRLQGKKLAHLDVRR